MKKILTIFTLVLFFSLGCVAKATTLSFVPETKGANVVENQIVPKEVPRKIDRRAVVATKLPEAPEVRVPLYPDSTKWYNHQGETIVLWDVPEDILKVAVEVDSNPRTEPSESEESLFTGKKIGVLEEGEHYIHVQFKNSEGWGAVTHYKVLIDITPPPVFEAQIKSLISDNPSPEVRYIEEDGLSGYSHALLFVDNGDFIYSTSTPFLLPPQIPGGHILTVKVFDKAGNYSEDVLEFETLALKTPVIEFATKKISQGDVLFVSGKSLADSYIDYRVLKDEKEVFAGVTNTDVLGKWKVSIEEVLLKGNYHLIVNARDKRGAVSYDTNPKDIRIKAKTIVSFGFIDLNWFEIVITIILLVISGGSLGSWYYVVEQQKKQTHGVITSRDIAKMSKLLGDKLTEIESLVKQQKRMQTGLRPQLQSVFKKMRTDINKMKKKPVRKIVKKSK